MGRDARLRATRRADAVLGREIASRLDKNRFEEALRLVLAWAPSTIFPIAHGRKNNEETRELMRQRGLELLAERGYDEVDVVIHPNTLAIGVRPARAALERIAGELKRG